jgi:hexosaminidase
LFDYIENAISVINSDDSFYIVTKYSTSYPQVLNKTRIFHGDPATKGAWAPNIFDVSNATNNPPRDSPYVPGALAAQWNDYGPNTTTFLEAYQSWRSYLPALADKQWGGRLTETEYTQIFETLQKKVPGQNLDRNVPSVGPTLLEYATFAGPNGTVIDVSGNGYDATTNCSVAADGTISIAGGCAVTIPLTSKGNDYTLSTTFKQTSSMPGPILTGPDSALWSGNGTSTQLMLYSAGNAWALNYSLPVDSWVDGALIARGNRTYFQVGDADAMEFLAHVGVNGERHEWAPLQVVAPLSLIGGGGWEAQIKDVKLVDYAV